MKLVMRSVLLALPLSVVLASCAAGPPVLSEEEKAARITINPFQDNLTPDPTLAAAPVVLPAAVPVVSWLQSGENSAKAPGNVEAAPEFREAWRSNVGEGSGEIKRLVGAPVVKDGRIYTIDSAQKVSAFDASNGRKIWDVQLKSANAHWDEFSIGGGLAITGDKLIVASGFGFAAALKLSDGSEIWRRTVESPLSSNGLQNTPQGHPAWRHQKLYISQDLSRCIENG